MVAKKDYTGQVYARLTVVETLHGSRVRCKCACGGELIALTYNVCNGNTKSCGCLAREASVRRGRLMAPVMGTNNKTHGMSETPTYQSWKDMRLRCMDPRNKRFSEYGGRGISVDQRWLASFEAFFEDMGECPPGLTLERLDVNGNYGPANCKWATRVEQMRNTRSTKASPEIVRLIRARRAAGEPGPKLAREYGMCVSNIYEIALGHTWRDI